MGENYITNPVPPTPVYPRESFGIHQSDIVLRTAILAGIADMRDNPGLLDYVFASLPTDGLTYKQYGEEDVARAKEWFLATEFPVFMNTRVDAGKIPCITIALTNSTETAATLGDIHYQTVEVDRLDTSQIVYYGPFTPSNYYPATGTIVTPDAVDVWPGMMLRDGTGALHQIEDVIDPYTFIIDKNLNVDFKNSAVVSAHTKTMTLESLEFRETFEIGVHVISEPIHLTYLHSILTFILLRYKEELLDARGLERTTVSSGPVVINTSFATTQPVFTRMMTVVGFVRQYWPKFERSPIEGVEVDLTVDTNVGETAPIVSVALGAINSGTTIAADGTRVIHNVADPLIGSDAANKNYVDRSIGAISGTPLSSIILMAPGGGKWLVYVDDFGSLTTIGIP